jgi:3-oxoacyl-[acyl-carrier protein] reductase
MLLEGKHALVFAASGAIAGAVARRFALEGATVWLSGQSIESVTPVAERIAAQGGVSHTEVVDATVATDIDRYVDRVADEAGRIDVVFNGIGGRPVDLGYPASIADMDLDQFVLPTRRIAGSQFLTASAAARHMAVTGGGAIVTLSATLSSMTPTNMTSITAACGAVEALTRALAGELGPRGVRVNCVRGSAMPETRTIQETSAALVDAGASPSFVPPPLQRPISIDETAATAAFLASDHASGITGQVVTVCAGAFV